MAFFGGEVCDDTLFLTNCMFEISKYVLSLDYHQALTIAIWLLCTPRFGLQCATYRHHLPLKKKNRVWLKYTAC